MCKFTYKFIYTFESCVILIYLATKLDSKHAVYCCFLAKRDLIISRNLPHRIILKIHNSSLSATAVLADIKTFPQHYS